MGSADALKAQLKELSDRRAALELEVAQRSARLETAGVGMGGALVDGEGFPRADVDVAAIRADRHAIITLTNDHKALTRQMEVLLHQLHALSSLPGAAAPQPAAAVAARPPPPVASGQHMANGSGSPIAHQAGHSLHQPFAVVDEVTSGSPAAAAGLQLGDQMCSFAGVTQQTAGTLQAVAAALQGNEGRAVEALVLRHGAPLALQLTPQRWGGRGLLGCHLRPL